MGAHAEPTNSSKTVVFVLAGVTDLRVVKDGKAYELGSRAGKGIRSIHEELATGRRKWKILEEPTPIERKAIDPDDGDLVLYPDKTLWLAKDIETSETPVGAVVIFNTCRDPQHERGRQEPVAIGPVLASWLGGKFGLAASSTANDIGMGKAGWVNVADGTMDVYEPGSRILNWLCIERIESAVRRFSDDAEAWLFDGGGLPPLRETVRELIRLQFDPRCQFRHVPEGQQHIASDSYATLAEDSYKARQHAARHIQRGDFPAAYAAGAHLEDSPRERGWIMPLRAAARFFSGEPVPVTCASPALHELLELERRHYFVAAALKAEAALRGGRTVEALLATYAFLDSAFIESVRRMLGVKVDASKADPRHVTASEVQSENTNNNTRFKRMGNGLWLIRNYAPNIADWCQDPRLRPFGIAELNDALDEAKRYRNDATHARLDAADAARASALMEKKGVWGKDDRKRPFLGQDVVSKVVRANFVRANCDVDLGELFDKLVAESLKSLREHPLRR